MEIHWIIPDWAMCIFYGFIALSIVSKIFDIYHSYLDRKLRRREEEEMLKRVKDGKH